MSADPAPRHLHGIDGTVSFDSSTGELCPNCELVARDRERAELRVRMLDRKIDELKADKDRAALNNPHHEQARQLFWHWQQVTNHRNSPWTTDRFWQIEPFLRQKKYGADLCRRAIDGAAYESWVTERRNGSLEVHSAWEKIFEKAGSVEKYSCRAPRGWNLSYSAEMETWAPQRPTSADVKSFWGVKPPKGWKPPAQETSTGQVALIGVVDND